MKCIACGKNKAKKTIVDGEVWYICQDNNCGEEFNEEDILEVSGKKSKAKKKFVSDDKLVY